MTNMFITNYGTNQRDIFEALFVLKVHKVLLN